MDKFFLVIALSFWSYLYYSYNKGSVSLRSLHYVQSDNPFGFWLSIAVLFILGIVCVVFSIYSAITDSEGSVN